MSDVLILNAEETATTPAFVSRLRVGRFTSPSGVESSFNFDSLGRTRGKKTVAHEVVDADETIIQDMGSSLHVFSMAVYFTGPDCDKLANAFFKSLYERYTPDAPGILNHPRWGDVPVIPFGSPEQTESYTEGAGVSRVTVEFRETKSQAFPKTAALSASGVADSVTKVDASAIERAQKMVTESKAAYSKFKAQVRRKLSIVTDAIDGVRDLIGDIEEEVDALISDAYSALDEAATPVVILGMVGNIIETVAAAPQTSADLVKAWATMAEEIVSGYSSDLANASTTVDKINTAYSYQYLGSVAVASVALAAVNAEYEVRDEVGASIDNLVAAYDAYIETMDTASTLLSAGIDKLFVPDHDTASDVYGVVYNASALLVDRAYSLKSRKTYTLSATTDPLTATWLYYGDLDMLDFFCRTNKIVGNEFVELTADREIVIYA